MVIVLANFSFLLFLQYLWNLMFKFFFSYCLLAKVVCPGCFSWNSQIADTHGTVLTLLGLQLQDSCVPDCYREDSNLLSSQWHISLIVQDPDLHFCTHQAKAWFRCILPFLIYEFIFVACIMSQETEISQIWYHPHPFSVGWFCFGTIS